MALENRSKARQIVYLLAVLVGVVALRDYFGH
jgi:hypothetical protein